MRSAAPITGAWLCIALLLAVRPAGAQSFPDDGASWDVRTVWAVNKQEGPIYRTVFGAADYSAYPAYYGALPLAWSVAIVTDVGNEGAFRLTLAMFGAYGAAVGLKSLVKRERPRSVHPWLIDRSHYPGGGELDPYSWPSGHATMAAAIATTLSLQYPEWYVVAPLVGWTAAVGGSRVWLGVHYPSDVLTGWALGAGTAFLVHHIRNKHSSGSFGERPLFRIALPIR